MANDTLASDIIQPESDAVFPTLPQPSSTRRLVRLRTLSNLRWMAVGGQSVALLVVHFGLGYPLPILACASAIVISAALNIVLALRYPASHRLRDQEATLYLAYDVLQLAALLYLTGGIENPFALMFIAPVVIAAATLSLGNILILAGVTFASVTVIALFHEPLPWEPGEAFRVPQLYTGGIWASIVIGIAFTSIYAWRIASEATRMSAGLAATQLALARQHRLVAIGALATAAAHELGTPLGTIAVVSRELERALPPGSPEADDVRLLRAQAERCRAILAKLARPEEAMLEEASRLPLAPFLDDIASIYRGEDVEIAIVIAPANRGAQQPQIWRTPELLHGLGNLIENAADFAGSTVKIDTSWDTARLTIIVEDDGPGFAPEIIERIGEPYVTSRPGHSGPVNLSGAHEGMGLGFFIAKTLLEQTGGSVKAGNTRDGGARITIQWPRGAIDGTSPPPRVAE